MNDHNLDDLIIDTFEPHDKKAKSVLTLIALLIVIVIIGIVSYQSLLDDSGKQHSALEKKSTDVVIDPELTLQSATKIKPSKKQTELSSVIAEKPAVQEKTEEAQEDLEITEKTSAPEQPIISSVPKKEEITISTAKKKEKTPATHIAKTKSFPTKKTTVPKKSSLKIPSQKKLHSPAPKHTVPAVKENYYIQVGSFSQTPSTRFLNTIKKHGFSCKITPPTANGTKKLLIGPYPSRAAADNALVRIKDRINKGAFIVKK